MVSAAVELIGAVTVDDGPIPLLGQQNAPRSQHQPRHSGQTIPAEQQKLGKRTGNQPPMGQQQQHRDNQNNGQIELDCVERTRRDTEPRTLL